MATGTIVQSINNSNFLHCKMPDGTLICFGTVKFNDTSQTGNQTVTDTFDTPFIAKPRVIVSWQDTAVVSRFFDSLICLSADTSTTQVTLSANRIQTGSDWYANYIAIGRWKN